MLLRTPEKLVKDKIDELLTRLLKEADSAIYNIFGHNSNKFPVNIHLNATPTEISLVANALKEAALTQGWDFTIGASVKDDSAGYVTFIVPVTVAIKENNS
jgi:hypothetical protein